VFLVTKPTLVQHCKFGFTFDLSSHSELGTWLGSKGCKSGFDLDLSSHSTLGTWLGSRAQAGFGVAHNNLFGEEALPCPTMQIWLKFQPEQSKHTMQIWL